MLASFLFFSSIDAGQVSLTHDAMHAQSGDSDSITSQMSFDFWDTIDLSTLVKAVTDHLCERIFRRGERTFYFEIDEAPMNT